LRGFARPPRVFTGTLEQTAFFPDISRLYVVPLESTSGTKLEHGHFFPDISRLYVVPRGFFAWFFRHIIGRGFTRLARLAGWLCQIILRGCSRLAG
jgi:hypothetical protein